MNRTDFMIKLEALLQDISVEERNEAMTYYREYFNDAGPENEATVIKELVSPEKVAATIKSELKEHDADSENHEYSETGYTDTRFEQKETPMAKGSDHNSSGTNTNTIIKIVIIVLIALAVASVAWPLLTTVISVVIVALCVIIGLFAGLVLTSAALVLGGVFVIVVGLIRLGAAFAAGLFTIGIGLLFFAIGLIACVGTVKLCIIVYPAMFRFAVNLFRKIVHKGKAVS